MVSTPIGGGNALVHIPSRQSERCEPSRCPSEIHELMSRAWPTDRRARRSRAALRTRHGRPLGSAGRARRLATTTRCSVTCIPPSLLLCGHGRVVLIPKGEA